ncbi:MAG: hypothetical protein LBK03_03485 [Bacteroidales bacterium]|jgi:hypothetical protein|nr:hypothetical protein [Bacteroidales bacterium]
MRKILSLLAVLAAGTLAFTACKKQYSSGGIPREPDAVEKINFDLTGKSHQAEFLIYKGMQDGYYRETASRASEENLFQLAKEYCAGKNIAMENPVFAFVLYYDSLVIQPSPTVTDEHIKGVSVYDVKGRKITHHLFVRNENSEFYEVENVRVAVEGITSTHLHYYLKNYVFTDPQNKSWITIKGEFAEDVYKNIKEYYALFRYEAKDAIVENRFFNMDLMCAFRDDFLSNSKKGEEYIVNYYYLIEEYGGKIGLALALRSASFFKKFNPVIEAFVNPEKHLTEIMFTDELSDSLLKLLDKYEKITKSSKGKSILASIRQDIASFRNKQLQDILAMIK